MEKKLYIITNESIKTESNFFFCDNNDVKIISEGLNKNFESNLIARKSKTLKGKKINLKNIFIFSNILSFLIKIKKACKEKDSKFIVISISPYIFFACIVLFFLRKKFLVYLRSDGYEEYRKIIGFIGPLFYHVMFSIISAKADLISCHLKLLKGKNGRVLKASRISEKWIENKKKPNLEKIRLLYVGRIKIEKGIFSLIEIIEKLVIQVSLTIVGNQINEKTLLNRKNITILENVKDSSDLINIYDANNIFILPSYTEGYSCVVDEALARGRPVIIFKDISDIINENRKGVFIAERNSESLEKTIKHIMQNYNIITELISQNVLPTKKQYINDLKEALEK